MRAVLHLRDGSRVEIRLHTRFLAMTFNRGPRAGRRFVWAGTDMGVQHYMETA